MKEDPRRPGLPSLDAGRIARLRCALAGSPLAGERDREVADWLLRHDPGAGRQLAAARAFHGRAARWAVTDEGTREVIFAASGLPIANAPHERAMREPGAALFTYADPDPESVLTRQAVHGGPRVRAVEASARDPEGLLKASASGTGAPLSLQLQLCLHYWPGRVASALVAEYGRLLPRGSSLVLSLWVPDGSAAGVAYLAVLGAAAGARVHWHPAAAVASWLDRAGLVLTGCGITDVRAGRAGEWPSMAARQPGRVMEAVARKPR